MAINVSTDSKVSNNTMLRFVARYKIMNKI